MTTLTFRIATPSDAPKIQVLVQSAYRGESSRKGWTTEADLLGGTRISVEGIVEKIDTPNGVILLGFEDSTIITKTNNNEDVIDEKEEIKEEEEEETLIACCELLKQPPFTTSTSSSTAYFGLFAVDPARQAGGYGRQVLSYAEKYCHEILQVEKLEMSVIFTRRELIEWYVRRGFRKSGRTMRFPYELVEEGAARRDDLYFEILEKDVGGV